MNFLQGGTFTFIGREYELNTLNRLYNSGKFEFAAIYGRRRVDKTVLISEFIKDKDTIFFTGVGTNAKQNPDNSSRYIMEYNTGIASGASYNSFQMVLKHAFEPVKTKRVMLVVDEYLYAARASKNLASTLQLLIDKNKNTSELFLIPCGSSIPYMEDRVLAYKTPLYGRGMVQFKINPLEFSEACRYFENFSDENKILVYGIIGGTPQYLMQLDDELSIEENIKNMRLNPSSSIFKEPTNLLKHGVREPAVYNAVTTAVVTGSFKMNEVSNKIDENTNVCATHIKDLIALSTVKKESPYGKKSTRKIIYFIEDNMFHFWYHFVPENTSITSRGAIGLAYSRIAPELSSYMGNVFEDICKQYPWKLFLEGKCVVNFIDLGRWWGASPGTKFQEEIDTMGTDRDTALFAECKQTNGKVDLGMLEALMKRSTLFSYERTHSYLFAKTGSIRDCTDRANEMDNATLVTYGDMLNAQNETELIATLLEERRQVHIRGTITSRTSRETVKGLVADKLGEVVGYLTVQDIPVDGIMRPKEDSYKNAPFDWLSGVFATVSGKRALVSEGALDYIVTKENSNVIVVIECKANARSHSVFTGTKDYRTAGYDTPAETEVYAINDALWYATLLNDKYGAVAIGIPGQSKESCKVSSFVLPKDGEVTDIEILGDGFIDDAIVSISQHGKDIDIVLDRFAGVEAAVKEGLR